MDKTTWHRHCQFNKLISSTHHLPSIIRKTWKRLNSLHYCTAPSCNSEFQGVYSSAFRVAKGNLQQINFFCVELNLGFKTGPYIFPQKKLGYIGKKNGDEPQIFLMDINYPMQCSWSSEQSITFSPSHSSHLIPES